MHIVIVAALIASFGSERASATDYYWRSAGASAATRAWTGALNWSTLDSGAGNFTWTNTSANNAFLTGNDTATVITITGGSSIQVGTLFVQANGFALNPTTTTKATLDGNIVISSGVTFSLIDPANTATRQLAVTGNISGGTVHLGTAIQSSVSSVAELDLTVGELSSAISVSGSGASPTSIVGAIVSAGAANTTATVSGTITNNSGAAFYTELGANSTTTLTSNGKITGTAGVLFAAGQVGSGAGTVNFGNATSDYGGNTLISMSSTGKVRLSVDNGISTNSSLVIGLSATGTGGGTLDLNGKNQSVQSLIYQGFGTATITNGTASTTSTLTINGSGTGAFSPTTGGIADGLGKVAVVRAGTGTTTFATANTYSGGTTVSGGVLVVNNATSGSVLGTGNVNVTGGKLQVGASNASFGSATASLAMSSGIIDLSSASTTVLTVTGNVTLSGGTMSYALGASNASSALNTSGNLAVSGTIHLSLSGVQAGLYTLMNYAGSPTGSASSFTIDSPLGSLTPTFTLSGHTLMLGLATAGASPREVLWHPGASTDGPGTWNNATTNFTYSGSLTAFSSTAPDSAVFGAGGSTAGTVTLSDNITAGAITFAAMTGGAKYTIDTTGFTLTVGSGGITAHNSSTVTGGLTLSTSQTWTADSGVTLTVGGTIAEATAGRAITYSGGGSFVVTGAANNTGGTNVVGSTLALVSNSSLGSGGLAFSGTAPTLSLLGNVSTSNAVSLGAATTIDTSTFNLTLSGAVTGANSLTKAGSGALTLSGSTASFSSLVVNAGTVNVSEATTITGVTTVNAGAVNVLTSSTFAGLFTLNSGTATTGVATAFGAGLTVAGGTFNMNATPSFSGALTVSGGAFNLGAAATVGALSVSSGAVSLGANLSASTVTLTNGGTIAGTGVLTGTAYAMQSGTLAANLGSNSAILTKTSASTATLTGVNSYTGGTSIQGGTLAVNNGSLGTGTLTFTGGNGALKTLQATTFGGTVSIGAVGATIDTSAGDLTFAGAVAINSAGSVSKVGSGTLTLTAWNVGSFASLSANTGTVALAPATTANGTFSALSIASGATVLITPSVSNATITFIAPTTAAGSFAGNIDITGTNSTLIVRSPATGGTSYVDGGGSIRFLTSGETLSVQGLNQTVIVSNPIVLNPNNVSGAFAAALGVSGGDLLQLDGVITGTGSLQISQTFGGSSSTGGTVLLDAQNSYSGTTTILSKNTLKLGINNALPTGTSLSFGDGTFSTSGAFGAVDLNGHNQTLASIATNLLTGQTSSGIINSNSGSFATLSINGSANATFASPIGTTSGTAANINLALTSSNTGTLHLTGVSPYTGSTVINGGTLAIEATGQLTGTSGVTVNSGAVLVDSGTISSGVTLNSGSALYGSGTVSSGVTLAGGTFSMSGGHVGSVNVTTDATWNGSATTTTTSTQSVNINSGNTLTVASGATMTVSSPAQLDVSGSKLVNNGSVFGSVEIGSGATVNGSGTFDTLIVNGTASPGNSPGSMTDTATTWGGTGKYVWEVNDAGNGTQDHAGTNPGWDLWNTGALTVNSGFTIDVTSLGTVTGFNGSATEAYHWLIATRTDSGGSFATDLMSNLLVLETDHFTQSHLGSFSLSGDATNLYLDYAYTAVPEPGTMLLGLAAASGFGWRWRLRRRRSGMAAGNVTGGVETLADGV